MREEHLATVHLPLHLLELIQVHVQEFKYNDDMPSKLKAVDVLNQAIVAFIVAFSLHLQFLENPYFYLGVVEVKLLIFANFSSHNTVEFLVHTFNYLSKGSLIHYFDHFVSVSQLLASYRYVLAFLVGNRVLVLPSCLSNCVYRLVFRHLYLLEFC